VLVDTGGVLWLDFTASGRPSPPPRPEPTLMRVKGDGTIVDSLSYPPLPEVESESLRVVRTSSSGGVSVRGVAVPYQPAGGRAWSPMGTFALFRTDEYRIELLPPPGLTVEGRDPWASEPLCALTELRPQRGRLETPDTVSRVARYSGVSRFSVYEWLCKLRRAVSPRDPGPLAPKAVVPRRQPGVNGDGAGPLAKTQ
jgi:hypothetical protein